MWTDINLMTHQKNENHGSKTVVIVLVQVLSKKLTWYLLWIPIFNQIMCFNFNLNAELHGRKQFLNNKLNVKEDILDFLFISFGVS